MFIRLTAFVALLVLASCATGQTSGQELVMIGPDGKTAKITVLNKAMAVSMPSSAGTLTKEELTVLGNQLSFCWSKEAKNKFKDVVVGLGITTSKDGRIISAEPIDNPEQQPTDNYAIALETAIKALNRPECRKLKLPANKYEVWRKMILTFDANEML